MDDSLIIARLTLMFLRASLPQADSLPPHYGVIILPLDTVLTQEEAILKLSTIEGRLDFHADVRGGNLVVTAVQPTPLDLTQEEAILKLSTIEGRLDFHADLRGMSLVVTPVNPTPRARTQEEAILKLSTIEGRL